MQLQRARWLRSPVLLDQVRLEGSTPPMTQMDLPVTFDSPTVAYGLLGFGGAEDSTIVGRSDRRDQ